MDMKEVELFNLLQSFDPLNSMPFSVPLDPLREERNGVIQSEGF